MSYPPTIEVIDARLTATENKAENLHQRIGGTPGTPGLEDKVVDIFNRLGSLEFWRNMWIPKLEGNGKKPLMQRVDALEDWQNKRDNEVKERRSDQNSIKIAIFLMIASSLWDIIKDFIIPK